MSPRIPAHIAKALPIGQISQLLGASAYAAVMWLVALYFIRFSGLDSYGQFAAAMAVAAPIYMLTNSRGRLILSSEAEDGLPTELYLTYRVLTALISLSMVIAVSWGIFGNTFWIVVCVALFKSFEAMSDMYFGAMQREARPETVGISQMCKGLAFLVILLACWAFDVTRVPLVLGALAVTSAGAVLFDGWLLRRYRRSAVAQHDHGRIAGYVLVLKKLLPFAAVALLASLFTVMPRIFLEQFHSYYDLGVYSSLMLLSNATMLVTAAMGQPLINDLSNAWRSANTARIHRIFGAYIGISLAIFAFFALFLGFWGNGFFYVMSGEDFPGDTSIFALLSVVIALNALCLMQWYVMAAIGMRGHQVWLASIAIMVMITLCFALIPGGNIPGAFTADALAQTFQATAATALILRAYRAMRRGDEAATDGATS